MLSSSSNLIGFVPTLEALPLVAELSGGGEWKMVPCPSYGRVIRQMLAGQFSTGLLPFEVFLIEILSRPALLDRWCVPMVLPAAPVELVMSQRMMKQIQQGEAHRTTSAVQSLVIGIESRNSLTRHQFIAWQRGHPGLENAKPVFKMLPMELMHQAMIAESIDGFVVPTPWGIAAEALSDGRLINDFSSGKLGQQLVLCCHRNVVETASQTWEALPARLAGQRDRLANVSERDAAIKAMQQLGRPHCDTDAIERSADLYFATMNKNEFIPDEEWLNKQIERLARLIPTVARVNSLNDLARSLAMVPSTGRSKSAIPSAQSSILDC
ncbi:MAG: hypothetical protein JNM99_11810 [Verrucomicrobiaceae bacterium]|nr:hypothetical protein [Verrucomicrobiaceae bacterium]